MTHASLGTFIKDQPGLEFSTEASITRPAATPLLADGVWFFVTPHATDWPASDLYTGWNPDHPGTMSVMTVPRNWPASSTLPGAINVVFFDGHAEARKLDQLWQLYWHAGYVPPDNRPGL